MQLRRLLASDLPALREMYRKAGFDYEFPDLGKSTFEAALAVTDRDGQVLMAVAAERIVQLYLFAGDFPHPAAKLHAIRLLHEALRPILEARGYRDANAFLPPEVERSFGRRLVRTFGWVKNWASYCIRF